MCGASRDVIYLTLYSTSLFLSLFGGVKTLNLQFLAQCFHNLLIRKKALLYPSSSQHPPSEKTPQAGPGDPLVWQ